MSRMIDADRLIEAIRDNYDLNYGETLIDPNEFLDIVEQQPTVKKQGTAGAPNSTNSTDSSEIFDPLKSP